MLVCRFRKLGIVVKATYIVNSLRKHRQVFDVVVGPSVRSRERIRHTFIWAAIFFRAIPIYVLYDNTIYTSEKKNILQMFGDIGMAQA